MQQNKNILIINDMPGYGKVALAAMLPILSHMGLSPCALMPFWMSSISRFQYSWLPGPPTRSSRPLMVLPVGLPSSSRNW